MSRAPNPPFWRVFITSVAVASVAIPARLASAGGLDCVRRVVGERAALEDLSFASPPALMKPPSGIADLPLKEIVASPGQRILNNSRDRDSAPEEQITINAVTDKKGVVRWIESWESDSLLAARIRSGASRIGDLDPEVLEILVNGRDAAGESKEREIPAELIDVDDPRIASLSKTTRKSRIAGASLTNLDLGARATIGKLVANSGRPNRPKVGIYLGSFDPIHEGHVAAGRGALRAVGLDYVVFAPQAPTSNKPLTSTLADRAAMVSRRMRGEKALEIAGGSKALRIAELDHESLVRHVEQEFGTEHVTLIYEQDVFDSIKFGLEPSAAGASPRYVVIPGQKRGGVQVPAWLKDSVVIGAAGAADDTGPSSAEIRALLGVKFRPSSEKIHSSVLDYVFEHCLYASCEGGPVAWDHGEQVSFLGAGQSGGKVFRVERGDQKWVEKFYSDNKERDRDLALLRYFSGIAGRSRTSLKIPSVELESGHGSLKIENLEGRDLHFLLGSDLAPEQKAILRRQFREAIEELVARLRKNGVLVKSKEVGPARPEHVTLFKDRRSDGTDAVVLELMLPGFGQAVAILKSDNVLVVDRKGRPELYLIDPY